MNNTHINYQEYLESYAWKALKKTKLDEQPQCECCGALATSVHHLSYDRLGREKPDDIVSICERCHEECHHVGGYQIKNDEEILRRRFEEIRNNDFSKIEYKEIDGYLYKNNKPLIDLGFGLMSDGFNLYGLFFIQDKGPSDDEYRLREEYERENDQRGEVERLIEDYGKYEDFCDSKQTINEELESQFWYTKNTQLIGDFSADIVTIQRLYKLLGTKPSEFKIINDGFFIFKGSIYCRLQYGIKKIDGADQESFHVLNKEYFKDKNNVYYEGTKIIGADPKTIQSLNDGYIKDNKNVYFHGKLMEGIHSEEFESLGNGYTKKHGCIYHYYSLIEGIDISSAIVTNDYLKDKYNVFFNRKKVEGVDVSSFRGFGHNYATDKYTVYYGINRVINIDSATFQVVNSEYIKDKSHVYINRDYLCDCKSDVEIEIIDGVDSDSFEKIDSLEEEQGGRTYFKDKNYVYIKSRYEKNLEILNGIRPKGFKVINSHYLVDNEGVYYNGNFIYGSDSSSFTPLIGDYSKDINNVYFRGIKVDGADSNTFGSYDYYDYDGKDKNFIYHYGEVIRGANPNDLKYGL